MFATLLVVVSCACAYGAKVDYTGYTGVYVKKDKSMLQLGKGGDVTLSRTGPKAASFDGSLRMHNGVVQFASTKTACTSARAGSVAFDSASKRMKFCDGSAWVLLATGRKLKEGEKSTGSSDSAVLNMMTAMMARLQSMESSCSSGGAVWVTRNKLSKMPSNTGGTVTRIIMRNAIPALKYQCVWSTVASHKVKTRSTNAKYIGPNQFDCPIPKWQNPSQNPFALFLKVKEVHGGSSDYAKVAYKDVPFGGVQPLDGKVMIKAIAPTMKFEKVDIYVNNAQSYVVKFSAQDGDHDLLALKFSKSCSNKATGVVYSTPNKKNPGQKQLLFNFKNVGKNWSPITCKITLKDSSGLSTTKSLKLARTPPQPQCSHFWNKNGLGNGKSAWLQKKISGGQVNSNFVLRFLIRTGTGNFCNSGWRGIMGGGCHTFGVWFNKGLRNERQCGPHPGTSIIPCNKFKAGTKYWVTIVRKGNSGTMTVYNVKGSWEMGSKVASKTYNIGVASYTQGIKSVARAHTGGELMTGWIYCLDFKNT